MNRDGAKITIVGKGRNKSELISLKELLEYRFVIPVYQRPYAWDETHFRDLLETVDETKKQELSASAFFGSIIVALKHGEESAQPGRQKYFIIDGQQRLTSFLVLLKFLREVLDKSEKNLIKKQEEMTEKNNYGNEYTELIIEQNEIKKLIDEIDKIIDSERLVREDDINVDTLEHHVLDFIHKNKEYREITQMRKIFIDKTAEKQDTNDESRDTREYVEYILNKCKFCLLSISDDDRGEAEDYAIDIFNTLNATGEALTAFEVFKSMVHKEFKKKAGNNSIEKLNNIEKCLLNDKWKKKKQNKYTDRLLLFISMIDKDLHCFKKLSTFRDKKVMLDHMSKELKPKFEVFVNDISKLHNFIFFNWEKDKREMFTESEEEAVCFDFFRALSHDRALPVLFNFSFPEVSDRVRGEALKACVAFTCLWRGVSATAGTEGIDDEYRSVTEEIFGNREVVKLKEELQKRLVNRWLRKGKVITRMNKENWIKKFTESNLYRAPKLARFMLFVAFHKRVFNSEDFTLQRSPLKFITKSNYSPKGDYRTVEHITPQSHRDDGRVGNLTLLPQLVNSSVGAGDFLSKAEVYKQCIEDTRNEGNDLPYVRILRELLYFDNKKYLDNGYLNEAAIKERGERLGHAVWETLAEDWLGWTGE